MGDQKFLDVKTFRQLGLLAEVNRIFFHPLGLALEVIIEGNEERLGGIWDYREDPEGMIFDLFPEEAIQRARAFIEDRHREREDRLGFIYQGGLDGKGHQEKIP